LDLCPACMAFVWAAAHADLSGVPINLRIVLLEPGESENYVRFPEIGDCK
jgi:hypothetical protein